MIQSYAPKHELTRSLILLFATSYYYVAAQPSQQARFDYGSTERVTLSMAGVILVLVAVLFLIVCLSVYVRWCYDADDGQGIGALSIIRRSLRASAARGLDLEVIEAFPTFVHSEVKNLKIGRGVLECAVCLNEFEDDELLRLIPKCDHVFHPDCIDAWLGSHTTCPVCRADLTPRPGDLTRQSRGSVNELDIEGQTDTMCQIEHVVSNHECDDNNDDSTINTHINNQMNVETEAPVREGNWIPGGRYVTYGSVSSKMYLKFSRSHSTGHSLVQPDTERFTLKLPSEIRKQLVDRKFNRSMSLIVLSRERSSRKGYRTGSEDKGKYKRLERSEQSVKLDRWNLGHTPSFLARASSFLTRTPSFLTRTSSSSVRSPKDDL